MNWKTVVDKKCSFTLVTNINIKFPFRSLLTDLKIHHKTMMIILMKEMKTSTAMN